MRYNDIDVAVKLSLKLNYLGIKSIFSSKTDLENAFKILPLKPKCSRWLVMKGYEPQTGKVFCFIK